MNNELAGTHSIDPLKLKSDRYFESLVELARESGVLTAQDEENITQQFMCLAYDLSSSLAGNGTSSISKDTFEGLLKSIVYCFSLSLKECKSPDLAVSLLKSESLESIYYKGKDKLLKLLTEIKKNRSIIKACKFKTANYFFNDSQERCLSTFFKKYNYMTGADQDGWEFGYPTYNYIEPLKGAEYIYRKQEAAALESRFLSAFENEKIHDLMSRVRFSDQKESYEDAVINIYQYVLCQALGMEIILKDPRELYITSQEAAEIKKLFLNAGYDELVKMLDDALEKLIIRLNIDEKAAQYAKKSICQLTSELLSNGGRSIESLFASDITDDRQQVFDAQKLTDEDFTYVVAMLNRTDSDEKKAEIISENIESLEDFEDIVSTCNISLNVLRLCFNSIKRSLLVLILYKYTKQDVSEFSGVIGQAAQEYTASLDSESKKQLDKIISSIYF